MIISMHKFAAIFEMKFRAILNKNMILYPVLSLGFALVMRFIFGGIAGDSAEAADAMSGMVLGMGLLFSIGMTGMMLPCTALAEEKEKFTLRTLMTSSVNSFEFFLGSILPTVLLVMVINILMIPVSGLAFSSFNMGIYLLVTLIGTITSTVIGMLVGIFSKNQMSAGTLIMPVMLVFMFIPLLGSYVEALNTVIKFLYTGVITEMASAYAVTGVFQLDPLKLVVLFGQIILSILLFVFFYKRNGYEAD